MRLLERLLSCDVVEARMREIRPLRVRVETKRCAGKCGRCTWIRAGVDHWKDCLTWMAAKGLRPRRCRWRRH